MGQGRARDGRVVRGASVGVSVPLDGGVVYARWLTRSAACSGRSRTLALRLLVADLSRSIRYSFETLCAAELYSGLLLRIGETFLLRPRGLA